MVLKKRFFAIIFIALILTACSTPTISPPPEEIEAEEKVTPRSGGKITLAHKGEIVLNPLQNPQDETSPLGLIFHGLVRVDGEGRLNPALARSWQVSETHRTYTFSLREDVKWHDGNAFEAEDVVATFDEVMRIKRQGVPYGESPKFPQFDNIADYSAPDPNTFVVSLYKADMDFLYDMTLGILPASRINPADEGQVPAIEETGTIGTGPYKVMENSPKTILLKRYEDYFGPEPYIEEVEIKCFSDELSAKEAFKNSEVDFVPIDPEDLGAFENLPKAYVIQSPSRYLEFVAINHYRPWFSDPKVRRAMLMAIDREKILQESFLGLGMVVTTPILPFSWAFNSQIENLPFNPSKAEELLEEAGWVLGSHQDLREKTINGRNHKLEFELMVNMANINRYQAALQIEKNLKDVGISVRLKNVPWEELERSVLNKQFDAAMMGWKLAPNPDLKFMFASTEIRGGYNFVSYSNQKLDEILQRIKAQDTSSEELLHRAQEILSEDLPYLFLHSPNDLWAINNRVRGIKPNPVNLYDNIWEWWLEDLEVKAQE